MRLSSPLMSSSSWLFCLVLVTAACSKSPASGAANGGTTANAGGNRSSSSSGGRAATDENQGGGGGDAEESGGSGGEDTGAGGTNATGGKSARGGSGGRSNSTAASSNTGGKSSSSQSGSSKGGGSNMGGGSNVGGTSSSSGTSTAVASDWKGAVCTKMGQAEIASAFETGYKAWREAHIAECTGMARVKGCQGENSTCSEAMGYGMLLAVAADDQTLFDKLEAFRKGLLAVNDAPNTSSGKVMAWNSGDSCPPAASGGNSNSATDGDLDAAMALFQADKRWPGGAYGTEAKKYVEAIWLNQVEKDGSGQPLRLKPGNMALDMDRRDYISYYAPGYFHVFAKITGQDKWNKLADVFYVKLAEQQAKSTNGQIPDQFGGTGDIGYDSCRAPWRIAVDYGWFGDERAKAFLDKLRSGSVSDANPVTLAGDKNSAKIGALSMSGVSSDDATMQKMCDNWEAAQKDDNPYFQKTLRLLFIDTAAGVTASGL